MAGTFDERIRYLSDQVGEGKIKAGCFVDQPYAQDQHQNISYRHASGGMAFFLGGPLFENQYELLQKIANNVITETGSDLEDGMTDVAQEMAGYVEKYAPIDTGRLRLSGSPFVESNGITVYYRPPTMGRAWWKEDKNEEDRNR